MTKPKTDLERIKEAAEAGNIVMAPTDKVDSLADHVQDILDAIGYPKAWVSNESMIGDFFTENEQGVRVCGKAKKTIQQLGQELGLPELKTSDYVVDAAKILFAKENN